jgi:phosphopantetheine adenylyltransferase
MEKTVKTCIAIGYSFGDDPILNIFKDVLKRRGDSFRLIILSKGAKKVKHLKFQNDRRVRAVTLGFSDFKKI